jgi:hypothetical protein
LLALAHSYNNELDDSIKIAKAIIDDQKRN